MSRQTHRRVQLRARLSIKDDHIPEIRHAAHVTVDSERRGCQRIDGQRLGNNPIPLANRRQRSDPFEFTVSVVGEELVAVAQVEIAFAVDDHARKNRARVDPCFGIGPGLRLPERLTVECVGVQIRVARRTARRYVERLTVGTHRRRRQDGRTRKDFPGLIRRSERHVADPFAIRGSAMQRRPAPGRIHPADLGQRIVVLRRTDLGNE